MEKTRKYIFHCDYRYSISNTCLLVWIEICDFGKKADKFATREDIKDIFFKKNIPFSETVSADFYIPHQENTRILSSINEMHPDLRIEKENVSYLKKYIDCALIPFFDFNYFVKSLSGLRNFSLSPSFKYYNKFQNFVRSMIEKRYYIPGFYYEEGEYKFIYYPYINDEMGKFLEIYEKNLPMISVYGKGSIEDKRSFVSNLLLSCLNTVLDYMVSKGDADDFAEKALRASSIAHLVIKESHVQICGYNYDEWKCWVSRVAAKKVFTVTFEKTEEGFWRMNYCVDTGRYLIYAKDVYDSEDQEIRTFFVLELIRASQFSRYIKDSLLSPVPEFVDITEKELLSFLKEDASILGQNRIKILYPEFFRNINKLKAKIRFRRKRTSNTLSRRSISRSYLEFDWQLYAGDVPVDKNTVEEFLNNDQDFIKIGNEYIELDAVSLKRIVKNLKKEEESYKDGLSFFEALNYDLKDQVEIDKSELFTELLSKTDLNRHLMHVGRIDGFRGELRKYQEKGVSFMSFLDDLGFGVILADDMGLGKTIQIIAMLLYKKPKKVSLIVAPTTLLYNWEMELKKFGPSLKTYLHYGVNRIKDLSEVVKEHDIIICSYGIVKRDIEMLLNYDFSYLIIDEAQYIKNSNSDQAKAVKRLKGDNKFALTGTPIENRLMELWSIMDFVNPGLLLNSRSFFEKYEFPIIKNDDPLKKDQLHQVISPFVLRRMKTDKSIIRDLPDKQEIKIYLPLTEEQSVLYDGEINKIQNEMSSPEKKVSKMNMLATITKLKLICNHPLNYLTDKSSEDGKKRSAKLDSLVEMISTIEQEGRKSIIFTQFIKTGKLIQKRLEKEIGKKILFFHGSLDMDERRSMINEFDQNCEIPAMILSLKAGGLGLNLTMANYVFHFDRWWNPAVENQAVDRVHRIGQKRSTFVYKFITKGTLEERIDDLIESKIKLSDGIIPKGESIITELTEKDFINLIKRL
jgi:SNF2 family DNA or RNA helicase